MQILTQIHQALSAFLWGPPMLAAFLCTGAYLTLRSGVFPLRRLGLWTKNTFGTLLHAKQSKAEGISQRQALTAALAACLGTGNIVGVATALQLGGPGAVFWMWLSAALGMMTCCAENILGVKYRWRAQNGGWMGGPMAYLERGLQSKTLARVYAALLALAAFGIGNMTQANAMAQAARESLRLSPWITGFIAAALVGLVIFGGVSRIARVTELVVPFMTGLFLLACVAVLAANYRALPGVLGEIFRSAFALPSAAAGAAGYSIKQAMRYGEAKATPHSISAAMRYGVARGVFSNEAGLGSSAVIHAAADVKSPAQQGLWGLAEVFIDTLLMCTVTALVFLCTGAWQGRGDGVQMAAQAFAGLFGRWGAHFISLSIALFAFATLTGWSYYGEQGARYLLGEKSVRPYRALYLGAVVLGSAMRLESVWSLADILNGLMAVPNLIGVMVLSGQAMRELRRYEKQC